MSPDIEWRIKDSSGEQAVAKTPSAPAARWRASLVVLMLVLGAGLGLFYSSIKEPAPKPTPPPTRPIGPTATPEVSPLLQLIDRESQALADGNFNAFISTQDPSMPLWYQEQVHNFQKWERPAYGPLYYFLGQQPDSLPRDHIALDTFQYRNGEYFREMRFYRLKNNEWLRTAPDPNFWSGYQISVTQHFTLDYPSEDEDLIPYVIDLSETTYNQICADLPCPIDLTIRLILTPTYELAPWTPSDEFIVLPSPRIIGFYIGNGMRVGPFTQLLSEHLVPSLVSRLSGLLVRRQSGTAGWLLVQAVEAWEFDRLSAQPDVKALLPPAELSDNIPLIKLESLWTMQSTPSNPEQVANSVIIFIEKKYGVDGVARFLKAIGPADSFKQVIKNSLGVDEIQFEQQWQEWLKQLYAQGS